MENPNVVETKHAQYVWEEGDNIVYININEGAIIGIEEAHQAVDIVINMIRGRVDKFYLLLDLSLIQKITREAREHFARTDHEMVQNASAFITNSIISEVVGNFLIGINKNKLPTKLFKEKNDAINWLRKQ